MRVRGANFGAEYTATVTSLGSGNYRLSFTPLVADEYVMNVFLGGSEITYVGGVKTAYIKAGAASASNSVLTVPATVTGASTSNAFTLLVRDQYNNPIESSVSVSYEWRVCTQSGGCSAGSGTDSNTKDSSNADINSSGSQSSTTVSLPTIGPHALLFPFVCSTLRYDVIR